jgi:hypothetical protein
MPDYGWFSTEITYSGEVVLEYSEPNGVASGSGVVEFYESRDSNIKVAVEELGPDDARLGLMGLAMNSKRTESKNVVQHVFSGPPRRASKIAIETPRGNFVAREGILWLGEDEESHLEQFSFLRGVFTSTSSDLAKYWVIPLTNYIAEFSESGRSLEAHPLRFYVPSSSRSQLHASVIGFSFASLPGFVQPLPDYKVRVKNLKDAVLPQVITAVMIGEIPAALQTANPHELRSFIPVEYLDLLSLTCGVDVGAPWLEVRDDAGNLLYRFHDDLRAAPFTHQSHRPIRDDINTGTGLLLTEAPTSPYWREPQLNTILGYLIRSAATTRIEDRFLDLSRAVEGLARLNRLVPKPLLEQLTSTWKAEVKNAITLFTGTIRKLSQRAVKDGEQDQHLLLRQIESRSTNLAGKSNSLGEMLIGLCNHYGVLDVNIVETEFASHPRPGALTWTGLLSRYRNTAAHGSYFELHASADEVEYVFRVSNHLFDMLIRIVLKMMNYTGTYNPPSSIIWSDNKLDWVTLATPARVFNYP